MNVLTRYIVKDVLKGSLIAVLLLLTLFNLFTLSDELDDIADDYGLTEVLYFVALTSPTAFYELMPAAALLGSLFTLGAMGNHHELIAMRAAGLSVFGIIKSVMTAGLILVTLAVLVGEFIAPLAEQKAQLIRATAQHKPVVMRTKYGLWLREGKRYINVRKIEDNGNLADISIYDVDEQQQLRHSLHAEQAIFIGNQQWRLQQIQSSSVSTEHMQANQAEEQIWNSSIAPDLLKIVVVNPDNLALYDLALYIHFLQDNHQRSHIFEAAFWGRIVNPLVIFVMLLVSAPFVIGIKRGISAGARILIGVVIGMSFNIIDITTGHLGLIYNLSPALMAFLPSITITFIALVMLNRAR
ncbi:MAG: LPS export ABC transporter permease LptG [Methylovulum sp.]|nr:LPS export ABC transporter permease LptG [Methylovulum sp.]MCF7997551.1 LPS export ABC transporter permease LptG [Methylovulum sp.]